MRHRHSKALSLAAWAMIALSGCGLAPSAAEQQPVALETLDQQSEALKAQFNADRGKVRLLFIIDPNCATCLRGLADIERDLLKTLPEQAAVYIVHLPVVGGAPKHVPGAASLAENAQVIHYWDPERRVGERYTDLFSLRTDGKPALAWDVWFAYGPGATWADTPPHPDVAMHQLSLDSNPNIKRLDSKAFAQQVNGLLTSGQAVAQRK